MTFYVLQIEINPSSKFFQFLPLPAPLYSVFNCINLSIEKFHVKAHFQNSTCIIITRS